MSKVTVILYYKPPIISMKIFLYKIKKCAIIQKLSARTAYGGVAQLGERTVRIRKVKGSNPSVSTRIGLLF